MGLPTFYACTAEVDFGGRCRKKAEEGSNLPRCGIPAHQEAGWPSAPSSEKVIVKLTISERMANLLEAIGVYTTSRTVKDQEAINTDNAADADDMGRRPYAHRDQEEGRPISDSGTKVFGNVGVGGVDMELFLSEVTLTGRALSDLMHILRRPGGIPPQLVMTFGGKKLFAAPEGFAELLREIVQRTSWQVFVYDNLVDLGKQDTVNAMRRRAIPPTNVLIYNEGLWGVKPIERQ